MRFPPGQGELRGLLALEVPVEQVPDETRGCYPSVFFGFEFLSQSFRQ
jgi:hypothetical protein